MTEGVGAPQGLTIVGPVVLPFASPRPGFAATTYGVAPPPEGDMTWLIVRPDGHVTVFAGKVEYGQGIRTGFAVEVADELRLPLRAVEVVLGDTDRVPWDMGTFGSQSTARVGLYLRRAAATARQMLLDLAADRLDLPVADLEARDGRVVSRSDPARSATYGALVAGKRLEQRVDDRAPLSDPGEFTLIGHSHPRVDAVDRVTGRAVYAQDVMVPGMLYARVLRPPSYGAELKSIDATVAERLPGVTAVVRDGDLVAVLGESDEAADLGSRLVAMSWSERPDLPGRWDVPRLLLETAGDALTVQEAGSIEEGFRAAAEVIESTYYVPYVSTFPMEPRAAVAHWKGSQLTVWAGTQRPFGIRSELAQRFGIDETSVRVVVPEIGGGFGNKSVYHAAHEAARLAKVADRPVRVAYSRAEEMTWSAFRPAALIEIRSGFDRGGRLVAWSFKAHHAAKARPLIAVRGSETPYDVPNVLVTVAASDGPLAAGSYRSLGGAVNHFARESHMDEIAAAVGVDPVELRLRNLSHPRFRRVLEAAAARFDWPGARAPSGRGVGVAVGLDVGSYAAACVEVDVQGSEIRASRIAAALDCGLVINPDAVVNQVEGAIVMGLGPALSEAVEVERGRILNAGLTRYRVPRIHGAPEIAVVLTGDPGTASTGAGEPAIVPVAPAIANAVFDRTGTRHRELPLGRRSR